MAFPLILISFPSRVSLFPTANGGRKKMIGRYNWIQLYEGLQAMSLRLFTRFLGWAPEDVEMLLLEVRKDLRDPKIHAMFDQ